MMSTPDINAVKDHSPVHDLPEHDGPGAVGNDSPAAADRDGAPETPRETADARPVDDRFEDGGESADDTDRPFASARAEPAMLDDAVIPTQTLETLSALGYNPPPGLTQMRFYEEISGDNGAASKNWPVAEATSGRDNIIMRQLDNGDLQLEVNEERADIPSRYRYDLKVRGGAGDDTITVDDSVTGRPIDDPFVGRASITYEGGAGNDTMSGSNNAGETFIGGEGNDIIDGRGGDDYAEGGLGNDHIDGGDGRDVLYGGQDQDTIFGGAGRDYVSGGRGHDELFGDAGNDTVAGGMGNDMVNGGDGIDTLLGNSNEPNQVGTAGNRGDVLDGGGGGDRMIYGPNTEIRRDARDAAPIQVDPNTRGPGGDLLGASIDVQGSAEFVDRLEEDLEVIRSTESGQELLDVLDGAGQRTVIREQEGTNTAYGRRLGNPTPRGYGASVYMDPQIFDLNAVRTPVRNPEEHFLRPSTVTLQHELFHAWDYMEGGTARLGETNGTVNMEFRAVGLPYDQTRDGIPDALPNSISGYSENAFRNELGMPLRNHYTQPSDLRNFAGDAFAPFRDRELPGVNPPAYGAPYTYRGD
ncbi:MAG: M91 family zinc metallopeptidase [Acidobacteriota bacterium]